MGMDKECYLTQLIDRDGDFNVRGLENFAAQVKLKEHGKSYAVVSIMGLQSSGKSTLLNHLFGTNFQQMDAHRGRSQTTQGIWLARGVGIDPCTLVLDLEGTDGGERGQDDTTFERQSALFALAVSHIVLINTWYHNVGCVQATNMPLLKTIFCVMLQLFSPRKTTLIFVIRDQTETPFEILEAQLREGVQKIWESMPNHIGTPLSEFFNVKVVALSSYKYEKEKFKEQVTDLRQRFFNSIAPGGLAGDRREVVPALGFSFSVQKIWEQIKKNKDLDLPALSVLMANVRCEDIAREKYSSFAKNEEWLTIEKDAQSGLVLDFGRKLGTIVDACLSEYNSETTYFDESVRLAKGAQLEEKLLRDVQPTFRSIVRHLRFRTLDKFKEAFDMALNEGKAFSSTARSLSKSFMVMFEEGFADVLKQAGWITSNAIEKLRRDIDEHIASVCEAKLSELTKEYEAKLIKALSGRLEALLEEANDETWPSIRNLLRRETESAVAGFSHALLGFDLDKQAKEKMLAGLRDYARGEVESKAKEEAGRVLMRMKERFSRLFSRDDKSMPRVWHEEEDISAIDMTALSASLKMLSVMAAIRLDDNSDMIEDTLKVTLLARHGSGTGSDWNDTTVDPLASCTWEEIPSSRTLITPVRCKSLWEQFMEETEDMVNRASFAQRAYEENKEKAFNPGTRTAIAAVATAATAAVAAVATAATGHVALATAPVAAVAVAGTAVFKALKSLTRPFQGSSSSSLDEDDDQEPT